MYPISRDDHLAPKAAEAFIDALAASPDALHDRQSRLTPAMRQYWTVKKRHADALVLFQMGDFYETFADDAVKLAETLNITLTTRGKDGDEPIPLAGFPIKAVDTYLPKLVAAGLRVVLVDQVEDSKLAKGVVKRDIVRIITPGTVLEEALLDPARENFIAALALERGECGVAWAELSTGAFQVAVVTPKNLPLLLGRVQPAEIVVRSGESGDARDLLLDLERRLECPLSPAPDWTFGGPQAAKTLKAHFAVAALKGFGIEDEHGLEARAAGALLAYLKEQQRSDLSHIARIERCHFDGTLPLDPATIDALEITKTLRGGERKGSLIWALDHCGTSMGSRLLRSWLLAPLRDVKGIRLRQAAVEELIRVPRRRDMARESLKEFYDLERLAGRVGCGRATPRDLSALLASLTRVPLALNALAGAESSLLNEIRERLDPCDEVVQLLSRALVDEPPVMLKDGGVIREGFDAALDELRAIQRDGKRYIARFQAKEQEESGIPSLKIGYTSVFGYYLEITNTQKDKVPAHWIRKQTLKNAERYITPELKDIEVKVLNAQGEALSLETALFQRLREETAAYAARVAATARLLALLDVLASHAELACSRGYTRPEINDELDLVLRDGRHPVLELTVPGGRVVANDCALSDAVPVMMITGPNMAGKSTYIRMTALLTLMAQCGLFVPAAAMTLGTVDRLFTRLGSADEIQRGNSTFMVEMLESANILNNASERSLVVLDEVGRGTSTFDGLSIAWAVTEYLADRLRCRTLFATHYHELTQLAAHTDRVRNVNVAVREWGEDVVFLYKIIEGGSDRSYGIHVARLAGLPKDVLTRARDILARLEKDSGTLEGVADAKTADAARTPKVRRVRAQLALFTPAESRLMKALNDMAVDGMPPEVLRAELTRLKAIAME